MEFPHLLRLIEDNQFDTIYHEHFSYFSFLTVRRVFAAHGLRLFDVEELPTHGGSLRIYGCHDEDAAEPTGERVAELRAARARRPGSTELDDLPRRSPSSVHERQARDPVVPDRAEARGQVDRRLRRAGEGQHAAELLRRSAPTSSTTPSTATRTSRATSCPARHIPIRAPEAIARRRGPTSCSSCRGTCARRSCEQLGYIREWGGRFARALARRSSCSREVRRAPLAGRLRRSSSTCCATSAATSRAPSTRTSSPQQGSTPRWCSATRPSTRSAGTLRGMHYQAEPHGEPKLVRCTRGAVYDVIVDLRPESETYCNGSASS